MSADKIGHCSQCHKICQSCKITHCIFMVSERFKCNFFACQFFFQFAFFIGKSSCSSLNILSSSNESVFNAIESV